MGGVSENVPTVNMHTLGSEGQRDAVDVGGVAGAAEMQDEQSGEYAEGVAAMGGNVAC